MARLACRLFAAKALVPFAMSIAAIVSLYFCAGNNSIIEERPDQGGARDRCLADRACGACGTDR